MLRRLIFLLVAGTMAYAQKRPFDANAMMDLKRIGDPQISPDGKWVTFTVQTVDLRTSLVYEVRVYVTDTADELRLGMPATIIVPLDRSVTSSAK